MAITIGKTATVVLNRFCNLVLKPEPVATGGGGGGVTPTPTPNWDDPINFPNAITINQTIQGISTSINLFYSCVYCGDGGDIYYSLNDGSFVLINENVNFSVNNNDTLKFQYNNNGGFGTKIIDVKNASDGNTILDTITLTIDLP